MTQSMKSSTSEPSSPSDWPELSVVQRWFQTVVTHPDGVDRATRSAEAQELLPRSRAELEAMVTRSARVSARDRIAIYANAYYARLLECLGESYPVLKRALGEEVFNGFAFGYLQAYPSRSYTLGRLGEHFAQYLHESRPDGGDEQVDGPSWPDFLIDLARLEWTIAQVFDGPGTERQAVLDVSTLQAIPAQRWAEVLLRPSLALHLLATHFPVNDYYTTARKAPEDAERVVPRSKDSYIAVSRREFIVRRSNLTRPQYVLLTGIIDGLPLGDAIERVAEATGGSDDELGAQIQGWFRDWTAWQYFTDAIVPDTALK